LEKIKQEGRKGGGRDFSRNPKEAVARLDPGRKRKY
jgi:hypothetical protein